MFLKISAEHLSAHKWCLSLFYPTSPDPFLTYGCTISHTKLRCCLRLGFSCADFDALESFIRCSLCQWLSCKGPRFNSKHRSFEDHINCEKYWSDVPGCSPSKSLQNHQLFQSCNESTLNASWKFGDSWLTKVCQWTHRPIWSGVLGWDKLLWSCQCQERTELCSGRRVSWDFLSPHNHHEFNLIAATDLFWSSYENVNAVRQKAFNIFEQARKWSSCPSLGRFHPQALKRRETPHYCPSTNFYTFLYVTNLFHLFHIYKQSLSLSLFKCLVLDNRQSISMSD